MMTLRGAPRRVPLSPANAFAAAAICVLCGTSLTIAAPCARPDVDVTFPPSDASDVPPNARMSAHYAAPALYDDELAVLVDDASREVPAVTTFDEADSLMRLEPLAPLSRGTYELTWPGLRGVTGGVGLGRIVRFSVRSQADTSPPTFEGLVGIDWDLSRDRDPCLDKLQDRFVFKLRPGHAADDAPLELLAMQVFQTRDPDSAGDDDAAPARVALRPFPTDGHVEVRRPAKTAGRTCFGAIAVDLSGRVSGGGEREVCVDTKEPPFFDGCAIALGSPHRQSARWLSLAGLGIFAARLMTRRRGARAHEPSRDA